MFDKTNNQTPYDAVMDLYEIHCNELVPEQYKEGIKADLKRRFDIKLKL